MCVYDSILTAKKVDEFAFAEKLFDWFEDSPMGIGHTVYMRWSNTPGQYLIQI
jgi:hypothetical protein